MDWVTCTSAPCGCGGYFATLARPTGILGNVCAIHVFEKCLYYLHNLRQANAELATRETFAFELRHRYQVRVWRMFGNFAPAQIIRPTEISETIIVCGYGMAPHS